MPKMAIAAIAHSAGPQPNVSFIYAMPIPETRVDRYPMMPVKPLAMAAASLVAWLATVMPIRA